RDFDTYVVESTSHATHKREPLYTCEHGHAHKCAPQLMRHILFCKIEPTLCVTPTRQQVCHIFCNALGLSNYIHTSAEPVAHRAKTHTALAASELARVKGEHRQDCFEMCSALYAASCAMYTIYIYVRAVYEAAQDCAQHQQHEQKLPCTWKYRRNKKNETKKNRTCARAIFYVDALYILSRPSAFAVREARDIPYKTSLSTCPVYNKNWRPNRDHLWQDCSTSRKFTKMSTPRTTNTDKDKSLDRYNKVADAEEQQSVRSVVDQKAEPMAVDAKEDDENPLRFVKDESKEEAFDIVEGPKTENNDTKTKRMETTEDPTHFWRSRYRAGGSNGDKLSWLVVSSFSAKMLDVFILRRVGAAARKVSRAIADARRTTIALSRRAAGRTPTVVAEADEVCDGSDRPGVHGRTEMTRGMRRSSCSLLSMLSVIVMSGAETVTRDPGHTDFTRVDTRCSRCSRRGRCHIWVAHSSRSKYSHPLLQLRQHFTALVLPSTKLVQLARHTFVQLSNSASVLQYSSTVFELGLCEIVQPLVDCSHTGVQLVKPGIHTGLECHKPSWWSAGFMWSHACISRSASSSSTFIYSQYTHRFNAAMPGYVLLLYERASAQRLSNFNSSSRVRCAFSARFQLFRAYATVAAAITIFSGYTVRANALIQHIKEREREIRSARIRENKRQRDSREQNDVLAATAIRVRSVYSYVYGRLTAATAAAVVAAAIHVQASSIACFSRKFKEHVHGEANGKKETRCIRPRAVSVAV
ncbi:unnamed protein product, partial [Trichogramma brassicae]